MNNKKMNPILMVLLIIIGLNLIGFFLKMIFQFAVLAAIVFAGYVLWQKLSKKA